MKIIKKKSKLKELLCSLSKQKIGFVPTMGALHAGHISLIKASKSRCDLTICSIYVNPTQFNNEHDLKTYPNNLKKDIFLLKNISLDQKTMGFLCMPYLSLLHLNHNNLSLTLLFQEN